MRGKRREVMVAACYVANWPGLHRTPMPLLGHTWVAVCGGTILSRSGRLSRCLMSFAEIAAPTNPPPGDCGNPPFPPRCEWCCIGCIGLGPENWANVSRLYMGSDTRADALLVGCLVGLSAAWGLLPKSRDFALRFRIVALVSAAGLATCPGPVLLDHFAILPRAVHPGRPDGRGHSRSPARRRRAEPTPCWSRAPLVGIGRISYALYLFHMPILSWLKPMGRSSAAPGGDVVGDRPHFKRRPALVLLRGSALASG